MQLVFGRMAEASEIAASKGMKNRVNSVFELTLFLPSCLESLKGDVYHLNLLKYLMLILFPR